MGSRHELGHADPPHRRARRRRDRRARRGADHDPPRAGRDLRRAVDAALSARRRRVPAPAPARRRRPGHQRAVRRDPRRAAGYRAQGVDCRRAKATLMLWVASLALLLVVLPIVVVLLNAANSIVPSVRGIAAVAAAGSKDLDAAALLSTTEEQVKQTVAGLADYGGSLDVILDDAEPAR